MSTPSNLRSIASGPAARGLDDHIAVRVARLTELVTRIATRTIEARWGLSNTDLRLLNILDGAEPLAVSELSRRCHVDKGWVSRSLRDLQQRRLITRTAHPQDARVTRVAISARGQALLDEVRPASLRSEAALLQGIDAQRLKAMLARVEGNALALMQSLDAGPP